MISLIVISRLRWGICNTTHIFKTIKKSRHELLSINKNLFQEPYHPKRKSLLRKTLQSL